MAIDVETLAAARTYTDDSLKGVGSVQGKNCTIQEITKEGTTNTVVFGWTDDEGNISTSEMIVEDGKDGVDGKDGKDGEVGPKGDPGEKGETGETGQTGASAYEVALANGFEGSEEDWLKSLTPTNIVTVSNSPFESHAGNFKMNEIGGQCEQFSTSGKNLLDIAKIDAYGSESYNIEESGKKITVTSKESYSGIRFSILHLLGKSFFLVGDNITGNGSYKVDVQYGTNGTATYIPVNHPTKISLPKDADLANVRIMANDTDNVLDTATSVSVDNLRIVESKDTPWEPYTGGMPAPNPDYPQEIKKTVVSEIKTHGKNLLPYDNGINITQGGITVSALGDGYSYKFYGTGVGTFVIRIPMKVSIKTEAIFSCDYAPVNSSNVTLYCVNNTNGETVAIHPGGKVDLSSYTVESLVFFVVDGAVIDKVVKVQLEAGSVATDYEPYTESTIKLSTPVELYGIGDVQDTIDVENGKIIRNYNVATENHFFLASGGSVSAGGLRWFDCNTNSLEAGNGCCSHLMKPTYAWNSTVPCFAVSGGHIRIYDTANTNEEFKAKYAGLEFVYQRATPTEEPLPLPDQSALNSLKTFDKLTYVEFDSEVEPTFSGETALTTEGSHILESLAKSNALTLEYLDAATYICDNLP